MDLDAGAMLETSELVRMLRGAFGVTPILDCDDGQLLQVFMCVGRGETRGRSRRCCAQMRVIPDHGVVAHSEPRPLHLPHSDRPGLPRCADARLVTRR